MIKKGIIALQRRISRIYILVLVSGCSCCLFNKYTVYDLYLVYLSTTKFSGVIEFFLISWTYDYLDPEWRILCDFIKPLLVYLLGYFYFRHLCENFRILFYIFSGIIFGGYLSRLGFILTLISMISNFVFVKIFKRSPHFIKLHWIVHLSLIYLINLLYGFSDIWGQNGQKFNISAPVPWQHIYTWNLLRMTSYNIEVQEIKLVEYLAYLLYPPLYYSGPLIQYSDWVEQIRMNLPTKKKHNYFFIGIFLLAIQILAQSYSVSNHKNNLWIWQKQISTIAGISFLVTSLLQTYIKFVFIWSLQECWASYDNIDIQTNNPNNMFMINNAQTFEQYFCYTYKNFITKYTQNVFSENTYINILLIYSITIILTNCDERTIWFFVTLFLLHCFEDLFKIQNKIVLILIKTLQQCLILAEVIIIYTTDLDIMWTFLRHQKLYWIPIFIGTSLCTQIYLQYTKQIS